MSEPHEDGPPGSDGGDDKPGSRAEGEANERKSVGGSKHGGSRSPSVTSEKSQENLKKGMDELDPDENAQDNKVGDWRNMRRIIAEDPEWSLATVPLLNELVVKHVVANFESKLVQ